MKKRWQTGETHYCAWRLINLLNLLGVANMPPPLNGKRMRITNIPECCTYAQASS